MDFILFIIFVRNKINEGKKWLYYEYIVFFVKMCDKLFLKIGGIGGV